MTGLIHDLQRDAMDREVSVADLLRKAKVAAIKLNLHDFAAWIELETSGYGDHDVPQYRRIPGEPKFFNPMYGWRPILGSGGSIPISQPVSQIAALVASKSETLVRSVSRKYSQAIIDQLGFVADVKMHVSPISMVGILEAVRDTILDWALKLESAGVHGEGMSFSKAETELARTVNINIGSIGNAVGLGAFGDNATITATQHLETSQIVGKVGDLVSQLEGLLPHIGLTPHLRADAEQSIAHLKSAATELSPDRTRLQSALEALKHVMEHAAGHMIAAGALDHINQILNLF